MRSPSGDEAPDASAAAATSSSASDKALEDASTAVATSASSAPALRPPSPSPAAATTPRRHRLSWHACWAPTHLDALALVVLLLATSKTPGRALPPARGERGDAWMRAAAAADARAIITARSNKWRGESVPLAWPAEIKEVRDAGIEVGQIGVGGRNPKGRAIFLWCFVSHLNAAHFLCASPFPLPRLARRPWKTSS